MILVTGAAGKTGRAVIKALAGAGAQVRALVRRPGEPGALRALGAAEVSVGSFEDRGALALAAGGAQAIYHICPNASANEIAYARAVAEAAKAQNVERFVYHSVLHPQIEAMPHHWAKLRVEEMLFGFSFALTILQPAAYMQNILGVWRGIVADGVYRVPYPIETRLSLVDLNDVAEAAALVLTTGGHAGAIYELVGTPPLTQTEIAATLATALRRDVRAEAETIEAWDARARQSGVGEHERATLAAMFRYYARDGLAGNPNALRWLIGRPPNDLPHFLRRAVAAQSET